MLTRQKIEIKGDLKALKALLDQLVIKAQQNNFQAVRSKRESHLNDALEINMPDGTFFLLELFEEENQLSVYPPPQGTIEEDEIWNKTVSDFFARVIEPVCASSTEFQYQLTPSHKTIEDCFGVELVTLLWTTVKAPRTTSARFRAWTEFLVKAALESGENMDQELGRWLEQEGKQPDEEVNSMLADYHAAHWILSEYFRLYPSAPGKS